MSIEPVRLTVPCRLPMDQAVESLMNWLASAGARPQAQGPTEILCEYGSRAPMAFGLIGGALAGDDKWPAKAVVRLYPGSGAPAASPSGGPVPKFCMNCGGELPGEGRFCPGCGSPISEPEPSAGPAADFSTTMVEIEVLEDLPNLPLLKQTTGAAFKTKYQQRLANLAQSIQQAVAGF